ncbi:hypothetical protein KM043_007895 [Ampulex compressa]|nr:hypothetical protein KM043_007895 [Ampulex compressa]
MFAVIGYRLEHAFNNVEQLSRKERESVFCTRLARTVRYQCSLDEFLKITLDCYINSYAAQLTICVIDITGVLLSGLDILILYVVDVLLHYFITFLSIFPVQRIADQSSEVLRNAYQGQWYEAPAKVQRLLLFIMKRNLQPFVVTVAGFLTMSFETFLSWPYSSFKVKTTSRVVISLFLITLLFVQVSKLIVVGSDFYLFLEYVPFVIYAAIVHLKYFTCWINNKMVRDILELIKNDWQSLRSEAELEVLRKYTEEGRFFTKFYLCTIPASRIVE